MSNWWIKFGCFLTGYNYRIVKNCSEIAAKAVKRYTSALLIVCLLWSFIGYSFTERYLSGSVPASLGGAILFVIIVIQIERQIILSVNPGKLLYISRGLIALAMAIIGAVIIDQIIFNEDIELEKITFIEARVNRALNAKTHELRSQINNLSAAITDKENERFSHITDIATHPTSLIYSTASTMRTEKTIQTDPASGSPIVSEKSVPVKVVNTSNVPNPKISLIQPLEKTITELRNQKLEKEAALLNVRPQLEKEISSKVGFLDELKVMWTLISKSGVALGIWLLWFMLLFGIEMLVLISKISEKENDYDRIVKHHMALQIKKLDIFAEMAR
jgi:hypothetical protein